MRVLALLVSVLLLQAPLVRAQGLPPTRDQLLALLGGYLETLRVQVGIPGMAAAIVGDTDVIWQQSFGQQDLAAAIPTRTDTPFHFDGLTQLFTASMVLQCVDQHRVTLDTPVGVYAPSSPDAASTVAQVLTHTSGTPGSLTFSYNIPRLDSLRFVVETCDATTFRQAFRAMLERLGMMDSVPGPDAASPTLSNADVATPETAARYLGVLGRLATPYSVNAQLAATPSRYSVQTLGAGSGLISTVLDFAKFDLAVRQHVLFSADTLAMAWRNPVNANGQLLPHGMGWFVQTYNGEPVVWQFGIDPNAASSLVLTLPNRNVTLILLANSDGLANPATLSSPATLSAGDVTVSPFARVFLGLVVK
ncbi:MAG TPA: serine hydrolase domain-containing protein [Vicinamibacterales bacterium]|nr:serine hydrolase domain-containing protein [Vicinamibacterales bacterium]